MPPLKIKLQNTKSLPIASWRTPTVLMFVPWVMENGCVMPGYDVAPIWNKSCKEVYFKMS